MSDLIQNDYKCDEQANAARECGDTALDCKGYWNVAPSGSISCLPENITFDDGNKIMVGATDEQLDDIRNQRTGEGWWTFFANIKLLWWKIDYLLCRSAWPEEPINKTITNSGQSVQGENYFANLDEWNLILDNEESEIIETAAPPGAKFADILVDIRAVIDSLASVEMGSVPTGNTNIYVSVNITNLPLLLERTVTADSDSATERPQAGGTVMFTPIGNNSNMDAVYIPQVPVVDGKITIETLVRGTTDSSYIPAGFQAIARVKLIRWWS